MRVFEQIRIARPRRLFIAADGPREGNAEDSVKCEQARSCINNIDWECEVHTLFREKNIGLKESISSAVDWFFDNVEEGIILEDDCLPAKSFFGFCENLLDKYRDDERIMMIDGTNFQFGRKRGEASYFFSRVAGIWGWATWRRAWRHFDRELKNFPQFKKHDLIKNIFSDNLSRKFWMHKIQETYDGGNSWAFSWAFSLFSQNALTICPNVNLVSNIGCNEDGVHAKDPNSKFANIELGELPEIRHPTFVVPDAEADEYVTRLAAKEQFPIVSRMKTAVKSYLKGCG
jgi:hypothetical protein